MRRIVILLLLLSCTTMVAGTDDVITKSPSPDKRFALRITTAGNAEEPKVDVIERKSGNVVFDLDTTYASYVKRTSLIWSADGKRFAYGTRGDKDGGVRAFFWNGSAFEEATLPTDLPFPEINFGKSEGAVKNYGGAVQPLRWLKSGDLEISNDLTMLLRDDGRTYIGTIVFTIAFDAKHQATIHHVGKTKTQVEQ
jgi:hypothetical protein